MHLFDTLCLPPFSGLKHCKKSLPVFPAGDGKIANLFYSVCVTESTEGRWTRPLLGRSELPLVANRQLEEGGRGGGRGRVVSHGDQTDRQVGLRQGRRDQGETGDRAEEMNVRQETWQERWRWDRRQGRRDEGETRKRQYLPLVKGGREGRKDYQVRQMGRERLVKHGDEGGTRAS
jgi:hypothetical protein